MLIVYRYSRLMGGYRPCKGNAGLLGGVSPPRRSWSVVDRGEDSVRRSIRRLRIARLWEAPTPGVLRVGTFAAQGMENLHTASEAAVGAVEDTDPEVLTTNIGYKWADELSAFQLFLLFAADRSPVKHGLGLKKEIEDLLGSKQNHGRLYPNLDQMVEDDLLDKFAIDERTNGYKLTPKGGRVLDAALLWMLKQREYSDIDDKEMSSSEELEDELLTEEVEA